MSKIILTVYKPVNSLIDDKCLPYKHLLYYRSIVNIVNEVPAVGLKILPAQILQAQDILCTINTNIALALYSNAALWWK